MKHYFLITMPLEGTELADTDMPIQKNGLGETRFIRGSRIDDNEIEEPVKIDLQYPEDVMPEMFETPLLIREDLLADLLEFGIDNIDTYACELMDHQSGKVWTNYKLCNIIGLIDVFDMSASELHQDSPPDVAYLFNKIVLDKEKTYGHHLFRPYGRMSQLLVSEDLKLYLESKNKYPHLKFIVPEKFA